MLEVRDLSIRLGEFSVRDISLTVEKGQYLCLAGPTGAGKTVLLECIAGLHRPDRGGIQLRGRDVTALPPEARGIGYVPQDYALFPHMTVFENIAYGLRERGVRRDAVTRKVQEAAETMQIAYLLERDVLHLSGGERQRAAFARALVLDCELLLLDESLSALDVVTTKELSIQLADLHHQLGLTVIHVTHDFDEAFSLATHIGICHQGRLLQLDTVEEVFTRPACRTVAEFVGIANVFPRPGANPQTCPVVSRLYQSPTQELSGRCVCIRPDQLRFSRNGLSATGLAIPGTVRQVRWLGPLHEVVLDAGVSMIATISRQEQETLKLRPGDSVSIHVPDEALHVLDDR
jgi:ABC-type Fe3+/spermidine/putrescine transport system ATPase subunit